MRGSMAPKSWLYGLLGIFVILGLAYGLTIPLFESSDEFSHLQVIRYFANERTLPPPVFPDRRADSGAAMAWFLTFHDPPLYYAPPLYHALGAALTFWSPMEDLPARLIPNPAWAKGWSPESTTDPWNKNIYVHLPDETVLQSATVRAALFLRLISLLLACVPIVCAYQMARLLWPERPALALAAAGFVALNPQYIATAASVTNDLLLCALFSLAVLAMVKAIVSQGWGWRQWALLGVIVGLAVLVKQSALLLLPLGAVAILWQTPDVAWRHWRKWLADGAAFGLAALCVGGWWYGMNAMRYGDLLGTATHTQSQVALTGFDLQAAASSFRSYWAAFGWGIPAPDWFYWVMGGIVVVALLGMVKSCVPSGEVIGLITLRLTRSKPCPRGGRSLTAHVSGAGERAPSGEVWRLELPVRRSLAFLSGVLFINGIAFVRWAVSTGAPFGRLLFPSIAASGVLWAWGAGQWFQGKSLRWVSLGLGVGLVCFAAWVPWGLLRPAYVSPYCERLPDDMIPQDMAFENGLRFVGYTDVDQALSPGDHLRVMLYWQAEQAPAELYSVWSQLGPQDPTQYVAGDDRWLGGTLYPSHLWETGTIVQHALELQIPEWTPAPALYWLRFGLVDEQQQRQPLSGGDDVITLGPWRVRNAVKLAAPAYKTDFRLGEAITLAGYDVTIAETVSVTLTWQATGTPDADYTVFVHLIGEDGTLIAQDDGFPAAGAYPTSWWLPGDVIQDHHTLSPAEMPQTSLYFRVGLYERESGQRLPAYAADRERLPDDVIELYPCEGCE